ncbi:MAG: LmeA family phospholipid-binding protein [Waterburya sp.]
MEILTIVLAGLLGIGSSGGVVLDQIAQNKIRSQVMSVEDQAVRIDNQPNYRVAQGKIARIRIAAKGVNIKPGVRIAALEVETDPIAVKSKLEVNSIENLRESLVAPAGGGIKVVLTEKDLNQALQSKEIQEQLQKTLNRLIVSKAGSTNISYRLEDLQVALQPQNRLQVNFKLSRPTPNLSLESSSTPGTSGKKKPSRELAISLELTLKVIDGKALQLLDPQGTVNGRPMSSRLLKGFATGISDRLNLNTLSADGILARILQLEIKEDNLQLIGFLRLEPKKL